MKKTILIGAGILLLIIIGIGVAYELYPKQDPVPVATTGTSFPLATSTTSNPSQPGISSQKTMTVPARGDGSPIAVRDFLHNGVTMEDPQNPGTYYLAGSQYYCTTAACGAGFVHENFNIVYDSSTRFFTIDLRDEPLGASRQEAERFLMNTLGINGDMFCSIDYYLGTDVDVNEAYAGKNLGFSFCPHATPLP